MAGGRLGYLIGGSNGPDDSAWRVESLLYGQYFLLGGGWLPGCSWSFHARPQFTAMVVRDWRSLDLLVNFVTGFGFGPRGASDQPNAPVGTSTATIGRRIIGEGCNADPI